jgi:hypothetical protein
MGHFLIALYIITKVISHYIWSKWVSLFISHYTLCKYIRSADLSLEHKISRQRKIFSNNIFLNILLCVFYYNHWVYIMLYNYE